MSANKQEMVMVQEAFAGIENMGLNDQQKQQKLQSLKSVQNQDLTPTMSEEAMTVEEQKANQIIDKMFSMDLKNPEIQEGLILGMSKMNEGTMQKASEFTSSKLDARMGDLKGTAEGNALFDQMLGLNEKLREIHPSNFDLTEGFLVKILPFLSPVRKYFDQFRTTKAVIDETREKLEKSIEEQKVDMNILRQDKKNLQEIAVQVKAAIEMNNFMKAKIEEKLNMEVSDEEVRSFLEAQVLFTITREIQALQELLTVNMQGQQSFEMLLRTGIDLIDSAKRCINVSVNALTIAAVIAHVVTGQKKMLEAIKAVNETATKSVEWNAQQLSGVVAEVGRQAVETNLDVNVLVKAIDMSVQAINDDIQFRRDSLPMMNENVSRLDEATKKAEEATTKLEKGRAFKENYSKEAESVFQF